MRQYQFAEGIQLKFKSKEDLPVLLAELASEWNSKTTKTTKKRDENLHPTKAFLYDFAGGLTICVCWDTIEQQRGVELPEIYATVPYIIVDNSKILVSGKYITVDDDGSGTELLKEFISGYWAGNPEPIKSPASRQKVKNLNNDKFPKMLIDLVSTLETFHAAGFSTEKLNGKQIPDYEMAVWLRQIAGDTYKNEEQFYAFLDEARQNSLLSPLNGIAFDDAVIKLQSEKPAIYQFLCERSYLVREEVRS